MADYAESELRTFAELPFSVSDSMLLAQLAYLRFENLTPELLDTSRPFALSALLRAELFGPLFSGMTHPDRNRRLLLALGVSPRWRSTRLLRFDSACSAELQEQFAAFALELPDGTTYVAYRGTDATLVGWKEDLNMSFSDSVPSQLRGTEFLSSVAAELGGRLRLGGHSKGGNLALYAAIHCGRELQDRLDSVHCFDSPGFRDAAIFDTPEYLRIKPVTLKLLPQSSVIGMLLENRDDYSVVRSSRFGLMQHDLFSWGVENGDPVRELRMTNSASTVDSAISEWLRSLSNTERELFSDTLYAVLSSASRDPATGLPHLSEITRCLGTVKNLDPPTRRFLLQTFGKLAALSVRHFV